MVLTKLLDLLGTVKGSCKGHHRFSETTILRPTRCNIESYKNDQGYRKKNQADSYCD